MGPGKYGLVPRSKVKTKLSVSQSLFMKIKYSVYVLQLVAACHYLNQQLHVGNDILEVCSVAWGSWLVAIRHGITGTPQETM